MNQPCPVSIKCPGGPQGINTLDADSPVSNFSSEAPDQILFGATGYPIWNPDNPIGVDPTGNDPGLPPAWFAQGCNGPCYSPISEADAIACAIRQAYQCQQDKRKPAPVEFFNSQQQCTFTCPDGSPFVWTVAAGYVVAGNQQLADRIAQEIACQQAAANFLCLPSLASGCQGVSYNQTLTAAAGPAVTAPLVFTIKTGALPPGLTLFNLSNSTALISGVPNTAGSFTFQLQVTDANGNLMQKNYTLDILGITNLTSLPHPMANRAYSEQLLATGGAAPFTFSIIAGGLPTGLTLTAAGLISGTPSVHYSGAFLATFLVRDANGKSCAADWNSVVDEPPGPDWSQLTWPTYTLNQGAAQNSVAGSGNGPTAFADLTCKTGIANVSITPVLSSSIPYTGLLVHCELQIVVTGWDAANDFVTFRPIHSVAGQLVILSGGPITGPGTYNLKFDVPISAGATIHFDDGSPGNKWALITASGFTGSPIKLAFTWTVFNL